MPDRMRRAIVLAHAKYWLGNFKSRKKIRLTKGIISPAVYYSSEKVIKDLVEYIEEEDL